MNIQPDKLQRRQARHAALLDPILLRTALQGAIVMLNPVKMMRNPVMFVTELGAILTTIELVREVILQQPEVLYTLAITIVLWITVLFSTFAEALAEVRGKAQADTLKKTRRNTPAKRLRNNLIEVVMSADLQYDDIIQVLAGEVIPADGEIIEGAAMVDESAITGESAPVLREAGGDCSSVTGGTRVLSDKLLIRILAVPGDSFLDRMIALVEGAVRQKTPNEIALTVISDSSNLSPANRAVFWHQSFHPCDGSLVCLPDSHHYRCFIGSHRTGRYGPGTFCQHSGKKR
jgi:K+-transporting ATPase ATPase B chain